MNKATKGNLFRGFDEKAAPSAARLALRLNPRRSHPARRQAVSAADGQEGQNLLPRSRAIYAAKDFVGQDRRNLTGLKP